MEVNPEMIPNLSRRAAESLKIELKNRIIISKNKNIFSILRIFKKLNKLSIFRVSAARRDS
jgi:hypothetical protein